MPLANHLPLETHHIPDTLDRHHAKEWLRRYQRVRRATEALCSPLQTEDYVIQTMEDVSPPKWHLAHVSWFFEAFILRPFLPVYHPLDPAYDFLFNSYYETHGTPFPRPRRGLLSRPTVAEVYRYRAHIDRAMAQLLDRLPGEYEEEIRRRLVIGLNHEQQHQELLLMDIKHILAQNPLHPVYRHDLAIPPACEPPPLEWHRYPGGVHRIGVDGQEAGFTYDNEQPRHRVFLEPFQLSSRPVSNSEFIQFMEDGGYERTELWLSDGWDLINRIGWRAPLYWEAHDGHWCQMTLRGLRPVDPGAPVCHVSFFEADAFARWAGARLPTEAEWEVAAQDLPVTGNFLERDYLQPAVDVTPLTHPGQMFGDVWEWTGSAYRPYPGFEPLPGTLGEYNGKFMSGQMVLRGGCCASPRHHLRTTYRNFFVPHARWAFSGFRLAKED